MKDGACVRSYSMFVRSTKRTNFALAEVQKRSAKLLRTNFLAPYPSKIGATGDAQKKRGRPKQRSERLCGNLTYHKLRIVRDVIRQHDIAVLIVIKPDRDTFLDPKQLHTGHVSQGQSRNLRGLMKAGRWRAGKKARRPGRSPLHQRNQGFACPS